jgi:hypothetical protein
MAKQIARLLRTDVMADIDVPAIAQFLQSQGRRGDSVLAHINPKEAALLKKMGGAETVNPVTGLPEYYDVPNRLGFAETDPEYDLSNFDLPKDYSYDVPSFDTIDFNVPMDYAEGIPEFPSEMSAASNLGVRGLRANTVPDYRSPDLYAYSVPSGLKMRPSTGPITAGQVGGAALAPELTVPERVSAVELGPSSMAARQKAELELARETTPPDMLGRASATTGLSKEALARLGLAGIGALQGAYAARQAAEQGREARRETEALARPYQRRGGELIEQAQRGELTPQGQQSLQALRARLAQGAEARGGVGVAQTAAQIEAYRQNLLQSQFDYGQKISNIGDQLMLGAIRTGLEADRYAANLSNTYFTNMARIAAGVPTGTQGA